MSSQKNHTRSVRARSILRLLCRFFFSPPCLPGVWAATFERTSTHPSSGVDGAAPEPLYQCGVRGLPGRQDPLPTRVYRLPILGWRKSMCALRQKRLRAARSQKPRSGPPKPSRRLRHSPIEHSTSEQLRFLAHTHPMAPAKQSSSLQATEASAPRREIHQLLLCAPERQKRPASQYSTAIPIAPTGSPLFLSSSADAA
jgi:hypothetical protein